MGGGGFWGFLTTPLKICSYVYTIGTNMNLNNIDINNHMD